jgi:hypothetical protein
MVMQNDFRPAEDGLQPDSQLILPDWVVALSESERSGRCITFFPLELN